MNKIIHHPSQFPKDNCLICNHVLENNSGADFKYHLYCPSNIEQNHLTHYAINDKYTFFHIGQSIIEYSFEISELYLYKTISDCQHNKNEILIPWMELDLSKLPNQIQTILNFL